ncbi:MAG: phosphopantetheine-binding protein [Eisenbergiella sp.]
MKNDIKNKLVSIFKKNCDFIDDESLENEKLNDLGINSLIFIRIIVEIEEKFDFEFDDEDLDFEKFTYLSDVCNYVEIKIK